MLLKELNEEEAKIYKHIRKKITECIKQNSDDYFDLEEFIGRGVSRVVYSLGDRYVLKYNRRYSAFGSNKTEFDFFNSLYEKGEKISSYFAKPVYISHNEKFMIMEKMETTLSQFCHMNKLNYALVEEVEMKVKNIKREIRDSGLSVNDLHEKNIMLDKNGEIKIVDYASNSLATSSENSDFSDYSTFYSDSSCRTSTEQVIFSFNIFSRY